MIQCTFNAIGLIHSLFKDIEGMPIQPAAARGTPGSIELFEEYRPGLKDLEGFSHVVLIYHLHLCRGYELEVVPFLDTVPRGVFATRAPRRPNPIGLSIVRLTGVADGMLRIEDVDIVDGTPLLDIKPYVPDLDAPASVRIGWLEGKTQELADRKSDDRFK